MVILLVVVLREVVKQGIGPKRSVPAKSPLERPATLRQCEALGVGMQVHTTPGRGSPPVGKQGSRDRDDAQQVRLGSADPAPDTCADRLDAAGHTEV